MDLRRINELTDELEKELKLQGMWDGFKTINSFARADYVKGLEDKLNTLNRYQEIVNKLTVERHMIIKRMNKLDDVHKCQCTECNRQRSKIQIVLDIVKETDLTTGT